LDLSILRRTAAEIAAAAVYELYPDVRLLGGKETSTGFFYDFYFPHPFHAHIIEEKMRLLVKERRPIRTLEMVAFSAAELLKSKGHLERAEELAEEEGLVEVIQIGDFYDLSVGPHSKNTAELAAFKITLEPLPNKEMRVVGYCHQSKAELKDFLKKLDQYTEPKDLGEQMGLWKGDIWLPSGLKRRQQLIEFLKKKWFAGALEVSGPLDADRVALHRSLEVPKVAEFWSSPPHETHLQISFFDRQEEEFISFLQLIGKTLTILSFDHSSVSMGRETDYLIVDGLGRSHPLVHVKKVSRKGSSAVDFFVTAIVEDILYQTLDKNLMMVELENQ
jgi:hypothetical protein